MHWTDYDPAYNTYTPQVQSLTQSAVSTGNTWAGIAYNCNLPIARRYGTLGPIFTQSIWMEQSFKTIVSPDNQTGMATEYAQYDHCQSMGDSISISVNYGPFTFTPSSGSSADLVQSSQPVYMY